MHPVLKPILAAAAVALMLFAGPALAETINFKGEMSGAAEVPPTDSAGTGTVDATFDTVTKVLTWTASWNGLSTPALSAHFHGTAAEDDFAGLEVVGGTATLDDRQAAELLKELWYFEVHTEKFPDGEIRGFVNKVPAK